MAQFPTGTPALKVGQKMWYEGLADLKPEQVDAGVKHFLQAGGEWPPSIPEFRRKCLELKPLRCAVCGLVSDPSGVEANGQYFCGLHWRQKIDNERPGESTPEAREDAFRQIREILSKASEK